MSWRLSLSKDTFSAVGDVSVCPQRAAGAAQRSSRFKALTGGQAPQAAPTSGPKRSRDALRTAHAQHLIPRDPTLAELET